MAQLLGDALRHCACRQPARLGVADQPASAAAKLKQHLRDLRGFAGARLTCDDHDLVVAHQVHDVCAPRGHRQVVRVRDVGDAGGSRINHRSGFVHVLSNRGERVGGSSVFQAAAESPDVCDRDAVECLVQLRLLFCVLIHNQSESLARKELHASLRGFLEGARNELSQPRKLLLAPRGRAHDKPDGSLRLHAVYKCGDGDAGSRALSGYG